MHPPNWGLLSWEPRRPKGRPTSWSIEGDVGRGMHPPNWMRMRIKIKIKIKVKFKYILQR